MNCDQTYDQSICYLLNCFATENSLIFLDDLLLLNQSVSLKLCQSNETNQCFDENEVNENCKLKCHNEIDCHQNHNFQFSVFNFEKSPNVNMTTFQLRHQHLNDIHISINDFEFNSFMTQLILLTDQIPSSIVFYMSSIGGLMTIWFVILIILLSIVLVVQAIHQRIDEMEKSP